MKKGGGLQSLVWIANAKVKWLPCTTRICTEEAGIFLVLFFRLNWGRIGCKWHCWTYLELCCPQEELVSTGHQQFLSYKPLLEGRLAFKLKLIVFQCPKKCQEVGVIPRGTWSGPQVVWDTETVLFPALIWKCGNNSKTNANSMSSRWLLLVIPVFRR